MKQTFKISIDKKLTEQSLIEYCLNIKSSGYDCKFIFFLYALGKHWHIDKLSYYIKLLDIENR